MIGDFVAFRGCDLLLALLDFLIHEFIHPAALDAHDVIVVGTLIELEHRVTALEMMPRHQTGTFELGQHPVHRGQANIVPGFEQRLVHVLRAHVTGIAALKNLQNLDPRQGHFQAGVAKVLVFHGARTSRNSGYSVIIAYPPRNATRIVMRFLKKLALLLPLVLLACAYRPDIKQGNFITDDMIAKLKPGMTQTQVEYVMGPAMVRDPFHPDRWDYMFYDDLEDGQVLKKHVVVIFKDGKVVSVEKVPVNDRGG